uniref:Uncharacterized protein n=1 Tax=Meloidogyne floridensis TaxID=298350 RepID=A0A915P565_9BILA
MALAEEAINEVSSPFKNWFDRDTRSPKPKFIRFGRSAGGDPSTEVENLDDLIDAVEGLYPSERLRQQQESPSMAAVYLTAPKRAQKFIRFGKK